MRPVADPIKGARTRKRQLRGAAFAGFTMIELVIAVAVFGILITLGMPSFTTWLAGSNVKSLADFYLDGLRLARTGAQQRSGASRFVLTQNANGQYDWRVDWCFPTATQPCDDTGTARWSTTSAAGTGDVNTANPSLSVARTADSQPPASKISTTLTPNNATGVYFNAQGWVNTGVQPFLRQLRLDAAAAYNPDPTMPNVRPAAIAINLSGMAERCDPLVAATDSRACSP